MSIIKKFGSFLFGESKGIQTDDRLTENVVNEVYYKGVFALSQEDYKDALSYFKKASSLGHISAKYNAGLMMFEGLADYPDFEQAKRLFTEAKQGGHTRCIEFLDFMNGIDKIMQSGVDPSFSDDRKLFGDLMQEAWLKIISAPEKQSGKFVYLVSRDVMRKIGGDKQLARDFIANEIGAMHLGNEVSEKFLRDIGKYDPNFGWDDFENNFNEITNFLDYKVWGAIMKASSGLLQLEQLVYARCCIVNEVMKKYSDCI